MVSAFCFLGEIIMVWPIYSWIPITLINKIKYPWTKDLLRVSVSSYNWSKKRSQVHTLKVLLKYIKQSNLHYSATRYTYRFLNKIIFDNIFFVASVKYLSAVYFINLRSSPERLSFIPCSGNRRYIGEISKQTIFASSASRWLQQFWNDKSTNIKINLK